MSRPYIFSRHREGDNATRGEPIYETHVDWKQPMITL